MSDIVTFLFHLPEENDRYELLISSLKDDGICYDSDTISGDRYHWTVKVYVLVENF